MSDVIQMAAFRKPLPPAAVNSAPASEVHIVITKDGKVDFPPVEVAQPQALAMLRMIIACAKYCLDKHDGRRLGDD